MGLKGEPSGLITPRWANSNPINPKGVRDTSPHTLTLTTDRRLAIAFSRLNF